MRLPREREVSAATRFFLALSGRQRPSLNAFSIEIAFAEGQPAKQRPIMQVGLGASHTAQSMAAQVPLTTVQFAGLAAPSSSTQLSAASNALDTTSVHPQQLPDTVV